MTYRHTQIGRTIVLTLGGGIVFLGWAASRSSGPGSVVVIAVLGVLTICLLLFISQTVVVDDARIELRVGPGLIRRRIPLGEIEAGERRSLIASDEAETLATVIRLAVEATR